MHTVTVHLNPFEHCPDCGALLVPVPGGSMCPHCGLEHENFEERTPSLTRLPGRFGEGARFHQLDDGLCVDEAA